MNGFQKFILTILVLGASIVIFLGIVTAVQKAFSTNPNIQDNKQSTIRPGMGTPDFVQQEEDQENRMFELKNKQKRLREEQTQRMRDFKRRNQ